MIITTPSLEELPLDFKCLVLVLQRLVLVTAPHFGMPEEPHARWKQGNGTATCLMADFPLAFGVWQTLTKRRRRWPGFANNCHGLVGFFAMLHIEDAFPLDLLNNEDGGV